MMKYAASINDMDDRFPGWGRGIIEPAGEHLTLVRNRDEDLRKVKTIANRLKQRFGAERVFLYGSVARGDATEDSDIDLLVIAKTTEKFYLRMANVLRLVRDLRRGIPLSPIVLTPEELKRRLERGDQFLQEIIDTGIEQ